MEPYRRGGGRNIGARGVKDTTGTQVTESTKQGPWGLTETETTNIKPVWV